MRPAGRQPGRTAPREFFPAALDAWGDPGGCRAPAPKIEELKAAAYKDFRQLAQNLVEAGV